MAVSTSFQDILVRTNSTVWCCTNLTTFIFGNHRRKVPLHSEKGTISRTPAAVGAERFPSTSKSPLARLVDTLARRWDNTTGDKKPRVAAQSEQAACVTWSPWPANSRMDSGKALKQRSKPRLIRYCFSGHQYFSSSFRFQRNLHRYLGILVSPVFVPAVHCLSITSSLGVPPNLVFARFYLRESHRIAKYLFWRISRWNSTRL